jgi:hypothetical protein
VGKIYVVSASSAISGVKPEHARLKPYENPWRICQGLSSDWD